MKWLVGGALSILALGLALRALWRVKRGRRVVLGNGWSPRLARLVVAWLVALGVGTEAVQAQPPRPTVGQEDARFRDLVLGWHRERSRGNRVGRFTAAVAGLGAAPTEAAWAAARTAAQDLPRRLQSLALEALDARAKGRSMPQVRAEVLVRALDEAEARGLWSHGISAMVWRRSLGPAGPGLPVLYARLHAHARMANALTKAAAEVKAPLFSPRAWMSKAGPSRADRQAMEAFQTLFVPAVRAAHHADAGAGLWDREGVVHLRVPADVQGVRLIRAGEVQPVAPGARLRLGRLDLLQGPKTAPAVLQHAAFGAVRLDPDAVYTTQALGEAVDGKGMDARGRIIASALAGDEKAATLLETALPLCARQIEAAVKKAPQAPGAGRLRLILNSYTEAF